MTQNRWHVWSVNIKQHRRIVSYLKDVPHIQDVLIPIMEKETLCTKTDEKKIKEVPLYGNYIFLKYDNDDEVVNRLTINPFFYRYVGVCTDDEAKELEDFKHRNYREFLKEEDLEPGMHVKIIKEPFKGLMGKVKDVSGNKVSVELKIFGTHVEVKLKLEDLRTELWAASEVF